MSDTTRAQGALAGSPRTPDMPDDIRQHACTSAAAGAYPATDMSWQRAAPASSAPYPASRSVRAAIPTKRARP